MKTLILLPLLVGLAACRSDEAAQTERAPLMPVRVLKPTLQEMAMTRTYTGRFSAIERADVRARVSGFITEVLFEEGQPIEAGQVLLKIDPALYEASLAAAEARLDQAEAALSLAEKNAVRAGILFKSRSISAETLDARKSGLKGAVADRDLALAELTQAKLNHSYTTVKAPISGVIGRRNVTAGNYVTGGTSAAPVLATVIQQAPLYFTFEVDERQALGLAMKADTRVKIAISDAAEFSTVGEIVFKDNQLDASSATLTLRARVSNEEGRLKPGAFGRVRLPISDVGHYLTVPETALSFEQSRRYLWVVGDGGVPERRYVTVGDLVDGRRVISGGLNADEKIAVTGIQMIRPGMAVEPIPAEQIDVR